MGRSRKPENVLHECRYKDEVIEKLKTKDWEESDGLYLDQPHTVLFLHDKDSVSKLIPFLSEYETAEFFTLLKAPYKEWGHVKALPYNKDYGLDPALIIELIRILYGGFSAKIMGEVIIGFLSTTKPIIVSIPYKDDRAVFIIAPALTPDGLEETEIYGEQYELDYTIGDKPTYYDLERQIFGFVVDGKIISMDEYRAQVRAKIKPPKEIPEEVKIEEKVKIRVLEDIPTFMGTDGEIYKLNKDDVVELPKTNADILCKRGVVEPFVEIRPPEEPVPEKVRIHGILKTRYRCPICYRSAPENFCVVHSDVEAIDLLAADEPVKEVVIDLTFLDLFKTKYPEKKRWTVDELHEAIGIDTAYAPEFLAKPRIPETYAQYYARELGVEIEEIKPPEVVKPPVEEERTETQEMVFEYFKKEIAETGVEAYQRGYLDALHREIGREFTVDHLLLSDSEELYRLMDLQREKMEAELRRRLTPVPPSVEELADKEKLEILRKIRKYKEVKAEVPELKIGAEVTMNDKKGVLVDISANKYRVNWDDETWDWIVKKNGIFVVY